MIASRWCAGLAWIAGAVACGGASAQPPHGASTGEAPAANATHAHAAHDFKGPEAWFKEFDAQERDEWQKPDEVIELLALPERAVVADVGAATGYFSLRIARARPKGIVYAVDIEPEMVSFVGERAQKEGVPNVRALITSPGHADLPEPVDLLLLVDTAHHIENRAAYFASVRDVLKPGGRIAIIDFKRDAPMGPPPSERLDVAKLDDDLTRAGFALVASHPLPHQIFRVYALRSKAR